MSESAKNMHKKLLVGGKVASEGLASMKPWGVRLANIIIPHCHESLERKNSVSVIFGYLRSIGFYQCCYKGLEGGEIHVHEDAPLSFSFTHSPITPTLTNIILTTRREIKEKRSKGKFVQS